MKHEQDEHSPIRTTIRYWKRLSGLLIVIGMVLVALTTYSVPGRLMHAELANENQQLARNLDELKKALPTIDKIHQRLQMYDTQLEAIADFDPPTSSNVGLIRNTLQPSSVFNHGPNEDEQDGPDTTIGPESQAETWVESILQRIQKLEASFEKVEPNLNVMVSELEDLDALRQAMPNRWPILGIHGSAYGWRTHPVTKQRLFHKGIDIAAKQGTPIFAAAPGTVHRAGWMQGYGYAVDIQHGFGIMTRYAHCSRLKVKKGQTIERGDLVGWVGQTGRATGSHLHFEIRIDNEPVDPTNFLTP